MFIRPDRIPATGQPLIDAAHQRLAHVVNQAFGLWQEKAAADSLLDILQQFQDMLVAHFDEEVALVRQAGYESWRAHDAAHQGFKDTLDRLLDDARASERPEALVEAFGEIDRLLYEHVFLEDQDFWTTFNDEKPAIDRHAPLITWSDAYRVGEDSIDRQHQILVTLLNRLHVSIVEQAGHDDIGGQLGEIMEHALWHFSYEEKVMHDNGLRGYETHRMLHRGLARDLEGVAADFGAGRYQDVENALENYLKYWLLDHIVHVDMGIGRGLERLRRAQA